MNETLLLWVAGAGVLATLVFAVAAALRRQRQAAERRRQAEAAALELARHEAARAAGERAAAQQAAAEAEARRQAEGAARQQAEHERRAAAEAAAAAERAAAAEARAAVEAAYREGERLAAARAAQLAAEREAEASRQRAEQARRQAEADARLAAEQQARRQAEDAAARAAAEAAEATGAAERAVAAATERAAAAPPLPRPTPRARRPEETLVMVADDSKVVRVKTSRLLAQHRYRVVLAEDGRQAAQLIEQEVPLVLVTDVEMPHMDGFELTRHVRQHPRARHIPIIMITSADERLKAAATEAGVTLVLGKPYEEAALLACIAQAVAGEAVPA
jgi:CheY-like chemotaxis protein